MNEDPRKHYVDSIPASALVVDVGGGANPCSRADYVVDGLSYEQRGALCKGRADSERFTRDTWRQVDLCAREPWPFPDKFFDIALCTHVLEDLRDPIWVCHELARIAKAGYVEVPSRMVEQSRGIEHPCYAGYYHHRWLVNAVGDQLLFRHKPHSLHVLPEAIVADIGPNAQVNAKYANLSFEWQETFGCEEVLCFSEQEVSREMCVYAGSVRTRESLVIPVKRPWIVALKRQLYFARLRHQSRVKFSCLCTEAAM